MLVSNARSEICRQWCKATMRTRCDLVATTLAHKCAKFDSFPYTGSKTVCVNMESCYDDMSTRVKQRAENVTPTEIHRHLKAVYGEILLTELQ